MRALLVLAVMVGVVGCTQATPPTIPPCTSDDGSGPIPCRWDATTHGDGRGESFTVLAPGVIAYDQEN